MTRSVLAAFLVFALAGSAGAQFEARPDADQGALIVVAPRRATQEQLSIATEAASEFLTRLGAPAPLRVPDSECAAPHCLASVARHHNVRAAWLVELRADDDELVSVTVWLNDGTRRTEGTAKVAGRLVEGVHDAIRAAIRRTTETEPRLLADSPVRGAIVVVDGKPVGMVPVEHEISPGSHEVSIVKPDGRTVLQQKTIYVRSTDGEIRFGWKDDEGPVPVKLKEEPVAEPTEATAAKPSPPEAAPQLSDGMSLRRRRVFGTAIGLAGLGVGLLVGGLPTVLQSGSCQTNYETGSCDKADPGALSWALTSIGVASVATGVGLGVWGLKIRPDRSSVVVALSGEY